MIRKAVRKDKADIFKLHYMAGEHFFNYFFASTKKRRSRFRIYYMNHLIRSFHRISFGCMKTREQYRALYLFSQE
jgi:hypothetical protein